MIILRDSIVHCPKCNLENFYDPVALKASGRKAKPCWSCGRDVTLPPRIRIGTSVSVLNPGTKLFPHHFDDYRIYDFSEPAAEVVPHPIKPGTYGLKNLGEDKWVVTTPKQVTKEVMPGQSVTLASHTKINFGKKQE